jgi:hypothetical protein
MGGSMPRGMGRGMPGAGGAPGSVGMDDILNVSAWKPTAYDP